MARKTVSEVAAMAHVSVRTLHHYHEIGLLRPAYVGENGYRYYGRDELLRLQQILIHRELGIPSSRSARSSMRRISIASRCSKVNASGSPVT